MARRTVEVDPGERALWADLMSLGITFPLCIVLGFFLGRWIGGWFGHVIRGQWIGLVLGIITAFRELCKIHLRLARQDAKDLERLGRGDEDSRG